MDIRAVYTQNKKAFLYAQMGALSFLGFCAFVLLLVATLKEHIGGGAALFLFALLSLCVAYMAVLIHLELTDPACQCPKCPECPKNEPRSVPPCPICSVCPDPPPMVCMLQKLNTAVPAQPAAQAAVQPAAQAAAQ